MRNEYSTRQKREMLAFLKGHVMEPYSVDELVFQMQAKGEKIGRTTVYRYLEQLAEQGSVRKYRDVQGETHYQHTGEQTDCDTHFHMMCKSCGRLYHVSCDLIHSLSQHICEEHNFHLDMKQTILIGTCSRCMTRKGEGEHGADNAQ